MKNTLKIFSPFDDHLISELDLHVEANIESALETASQIAQNHDLAISAEKRIEILEQTANIVEKKSEEFAKQAAEEGGKPIVDSRIELSRAVQGIRESARSIAQLVGKEIPMNLTTSSANRMAFTIREPIGLVVL